MRHKKIFLLDPKESGVWAAFPKPGPQELRAYMTWDCAERKPVRLYSEAIRLNVSPVPPVHAKRIYENRHVLAEALVPYDCMSDECAATVKSLVPSLQESRLKFAVECKLQQRELLNSAGDGPSKTLDRLEAFVGAENAVLTESLLLGLARSYLSRRRYQESVDVLRRIEFDSIEVRSTRMTAEFFLRRPAPKSANPPSGL